MATQTENVSEEVQAEEVVQPQEEQAVEAQNTQETPPKEVDENNKDYNFKQLREVNKQLEERLKKSEDFIQTIAEKQQEKTPPESEEELGEDDLVEGKHLKKALSKIEKMLYQKELDAIPDKLKNKFENFDQVVTKENLEKLKDSEPELYQTIRSGDDLFSKGVAAYKTIISLGYAGDEENIMKQKDQVHANHKKPLSAQAIKGHGALHEANVFANGLTPDLKKQLQKEMAEAVKAR